MSTRCMHAWCVYDVHKMHACLMCFRRSQDACWMCVTCNWPMRPRSCHKRCGSCTPRARRPRLVFVRRCTDKCNQAMYAVIARVRQLWRTISQPPRRVFYGPQNKILEDWTTSCVCVFWILFKCVSFRFGLPLIERKLLKNSYATLCSAVQNLRLGSIKFAPPKRRFWKDEQKDARFAKHLPMVWVLD